MFMKNPNDVAAQLTLAKNIEELKKVVEELTSKISAFITISENHRINFMMAGYEDNLGKQKAN